MHDRQPAGRSLDGPEPVDPEVEARVTDRVITFSDAVVAIAITLLALGLPPVPGTHGMTNGQVLHALHDGWPQYLAFLISFLVIGSHWATHRRIFRYASRLNKPVARLNMLWLLMMVMTPFAANLLAGKGGFGLRFGFYALIQIIGVGCLIQMSRMLGPAGLLRRNAPESAHHPDNVSLLATCLMFLASIPVGFITSAAFAFWAASPLAAWGLRRLSAHRRLSANGRHATGDGTQGANSPGPWTRS